ncbi:hypothetical protein NEF87_002322 [Candidatus Lokiarchaeum ossiferum]|uniref:Glycosyl hydrolase-like 10 domain-containing protein n=1 Tax=Candidatus Lokiarchaeum ossiferum TaxID=2951803 RepID=A0ABY6HR99_9ARCH|nr:hypothetical protein NEF87_002322 [Candidatus Lokiarchaeum sp. B-35]
MSLLVNLVDDLHFLDGFIVGVKIYEHNGDLLTLFDELKDIHINVVIASKKLNENPDFCRLAKKNQIKRFLLFPTFYSPEFLEQNPSHYAIQKNGNIAKTEWVEFVCPSRLDFRKLKIEQLKKWVQKYQPDGVSIDFIRHFIFWEKVYPNTSPESLPNTCFCDNCMKTFQELIDGQIPAKSPNEYYKWIMKYKKKEWIRWKSELITSMVKEMVEEIKKINPSILINIHVVPWQQKDFNQALKVVVGQDLKELAQIADFLSPMTYAHMIKQKPSWIASVVNDIYNTTKSKVIPSIQVSRCYLEDEISNNYFRKYIKESSKNPSYGFIFWSWERLSFDQKKLIKILIDH